MNFWKRLRFYAIGFGIGLLIVYALFGNRTCSTPGEVKMRELAFQHMKFSDRAACKMKCLTMNEQVLKIYLRHFEIIYDRSDVRQEPCGSYFVQPKADHASEYNFDLVMYDCDTITRIDDIHILKAMPSCTCQ